MIRSPKKARGYVRKYPCEKVSIWSASLGIGVFIPANKQLYWAWLTGNTFPTYQFIQLETLLPCGTTNWSHDLHTGEWNRGYFRIRVEVGSAKAVGRSENGRQPFRSQHRKTHTATTLALVCRKVNSWGQHLGLGMCLVCWEGKINLFLMS